MLFYSISTLGDLTDAKLCLVDKEPPGLGVAGVRLARGRSIKNVYPKDARVYMSNRHPGNSLTTLLGNTIGYLMVHRDFGAIITDLLSPDSVEVLPFTLYDHYQKPASDAYVIVNPLLHVDGLDNEASDVVRSDVDDSRILAVNTAVFDAGKVADAPHLFRLEQESSTYVASETLIQNLKGKGFSNVLVTVIPVVESTERQ